MEDKGKILTGEEVIAKGRRVLDLPSGGKVLVGRIEIDELTEAIGEVPDVSSLAAVEQSSGSTAAVRRPEAKAVVALMARVILKGTIEPELFAKRKDGPTPLDFSIEDRALMFRTILNLSSYTKEAGEQVLPLSETVA